MHEVWVDNIMTPDSLLICKWFGKLARLIFSEYRNSPGYAGYLGYIPCSEFYYPGFFLMLNVYFDHEKKSGPHVTLWLLSAQMLVYLEVQNT